MVCTSMCVICWGDNLRQMFINVFTLCFMWLLHWYMFLSIPYMHFNVLIVACGLLDKYRAGEGFYLGSWGGTGPMDPALGKGCHIYRLWPLFENSFPPLEFAPSENLGVGVGVVFIVLTAILIDTDTNFTPRPLLNKRSA